MPFTLTMPKLSPTMEEGTVVKWHKKIGDEIEPGDLIMEIATDKATVEFNALDGGWLRKILVTEGKNAIVNQPIAILTEKKNDNIADYKPEGADAPAAASSDKKSDEAPQSQKQDKPQAQTRSGMAIPSFVPEKPLDDYVFDKPVDAIEKKIMASPLAKKVARQKGLDLSTLKGSGPGGRIVNSDLEKAQPSGTVTFGKREAPKHRPGEYEEEPLSQMRKNIAQRLQESKTFIPHFYVTQTIDAEPVTEIREQLRNTGIKVTFNDFIIKACALALRDYPKVNSGFDSVKNAIIRFKTIDIAVAVSLPEGLITPILRHADLKNLGEISVEVRHLAQRAKEGKLETHEYKGGSFTISNLGMYGVTDFAAIINPPQAAILAISGIKNVPVVRNGKIVPGKAVNLTLSADHRVIDGVAGAEFLQLVQKYLENPAALLL